MRALGGDPATVEQEHSVGQRDGRALGARRRGWWRRRSRAGRRGSLARPWRRRRTWRRRAGGTRGRRRRARASAMRWRWPPERVTPRSPMISSRPCGRRSTNVRARAIASASQICSSSTSSPMARFSRTVSAKRKDSWNTSAVARWRLSGSRAVSGVPPETDLPTGRVEEVDEQAAQGRLAGTGRPDQRAPTSPGDTRVVTPSSTTSPS